ncbi:hypothetical protein [Streptomyces sp. NPDC001970]
MPAVGGCSAQSATNPADRRSTAPSASAAEDSRMLSQAELEASRLTEKEMAALGYSSIWDDSSLKDLARRGRTAVEPMECIGLGDVIVAGYPHASSAYAQVNYSPRETALISGHVVLASDSQFGARDFLSMAKNSLKKCDRYTHPGRGGGEITTRLEPGPSDNWGDESISSTALSTWQAEDGPMDHRQVFTLVRSGAVTIRFDLATFYPAQYPGKRVTPKINPALIAQQVNKVQAAQRN